VAPSVRLDISGALVLKDGGSSDGLD